MTKLKNPYFCIFLFFSSINFTSIKVVIKAVERYFTFSQEESILRKTLNISDINSSDEFPPSVYLTKSAQVFKPKIKWSKNILKIAKAFMELLKNKRLYLL